MGLRDLYVAELSGLLDAEEQVQRELPLMAERATDAALRDLFDAQYHDIRQHIERVRSLIADLDERPRPVGARGIRGMVEEGRERQGRDAPVAAVDAAMIAIGERVLHYAIATYRSAHLMAAALDLTDAARVLQLTLVEKERAARQLWVVGERVLCGQTGDLCAISEEAAALMPGTWVTETTGFASVPPRATSDLAIGAPAGSPPPPNGSGVGPEHELMIARGEREDER